eukprot:3157254-Pleurochrysis_carterae.AAC.1
MSGRNSDDSEDSEYWERRVILNNVRYNRCQAKCRLRARALERELEASKLRDAPASEPFGPGAVGTPQRAAKSQSGDVSKPEAVKPQTEVGASRRAARRAREKKETPRRSASPATTRAPNTRATGWHVALHKIMNVALLAAAVVIGIQHAINKSSAGTPPATCDIYDDLRDDLKL